MSKHGTGTIYLSEAGNYGCDGCHTGDGYAECATLGTNDPVSHGSSAINCKACHPIHTTYDSADTHLRQTTPLVLRINGGAAIDFKNVGNTCAKCHQGRSFTRTVPDTLKSTGGAKWTRTGPHYGVIANVMTGQGLIQIAGPASYPTAPTSPHLALEKGCVTCHMGKDSTNPASGGHTFLMKNTNLFNLGPAMLAKNCMCHQADFTIIKNALTTGKAASIKTDLQLIRTALISKGMIDTSQAITDPTAGYNVLGEYPGVPNGKMQIYTNSVDFDVILDYLFLIKDRSNGMHNPAFTRALVSNMKTYLGL